MKYFVIGLSLVAFACGFVVSSLATAHASDSTSSRTVLVPVLSECVQALQQHFESLPKRRNTRAAIHRFDWKLEPVPSVIGYAEISSDTESPEMLIEHFNEVVSRCYPDASSTVAISDQDASATLKMINRVLMEARTAGMPVYPRVNGDQLEIWYNAAAAK